MNESKQPLLKITIALVIIAAIAATVMIFLSDGYDMNGSKIAFTCFSLIFFGITGSICLATTGNPKFGIIGNIGVIISVFAFLLINIIVHGEIESTELLKAGFSLFILAIALAHISFLFHINIQNKYASTTRIIAVIFISIFSIQIISKVFGANTTFIFTSTPTAEELKILLSSLVLDLAATVLVPLCNRLSVKPVEPVIITQPTVQSTTYPPDTPANL